MSLDVWLKRSESVTVGGRELRMVPLPLAKYYKLVTWVEENAADVIKETATSKTTEVPNPLVLIANVLQRVEVSEIALYLFSFPKNPDTGQPLNPGLTKEFFDDYLDVPTAQELYQKFLKLNDIEKLIKNLQSLPAVNKLMEASSLAFGIPFLNSLVHRTDSTQSKLEGSPSHKSTDTSTQATDATQENGRANFPKSGRSVVFPSKPERLM